VRDMQMHRVKGFNFPFGCINNDVNGNPRYVLHFKAFADTMHKAEIIAKRMGWSVYRAKSHACTFVGQSYSLQDTVNSINEIRQEVTA